MKEFTSIVFIVSECIGTCFFIWLIFQCKSLFSGFITACSAVAVCYAVYRYAFYIAEAIVWGVRFAAVFGIVAFVLGIYPRPRNANA